MRKINYKTSNITLTTYNIYNLFKHNPFKRIIVIADAHDSNFKQIINCIKNISFDAIFIPGDLCDKHIIEGNHRTTGLRRYGASDYSLNFLKYCVNRSPVYYSLGNHEWLYDEIDFKVIRDVGCIFLNNDYIKVIDNFYIGGLSSSLKYVKNGIFPEYYRPDVNWLDKFEKLKGYKILLCHHPEYYDKYLKKKNIDLIVSGHAHGGQIRIGNQGLFSPGQGLFPKYTAGFIDNKMIISRGIANTAKIIPRINNKPEIVILNFL